MSTEYRADEPDWIGYMLPDGRTVVDEQPESNGEVSLDLDNGDILVTTYESLQRNGI